MKLTLILFLSLNALGAFASGPGGVSVFPGTVVTLPVLKGVEVQWVSSPLEKKPDGKTQESALQFAVDAKGNPWFFDGEKRLLLNLVKDYPVLSTARFKSLAFLDSGARILCTDKYLGALDVPNKIGKLENGVPLLKFVGYFLLPGENCRLYPGAGETLYMVCHNVKNGQNEISVLRKQKDGMTADNIFGTDGKIAAVAGDGQFTYIAMGDWIIEIAPGENKAQQYFTPGKPVTGLAYSPKAGLFYTTGSSIGFVDRKLHLEILRSPNPEIALRGANLYVRLSRTFGVVRVEGIEQFKNLKWSDRMKAALPEKKP